MFVIYYILNWSDGGETASVNVHVNPHTKWGVSRMAWFDANAC